MNNRKRQLIEWVNKNYKKWPGPFENNLDGPSPSLINAEWVNEPYLSKLPILRCNLGGCQITSLDCFPASRGGAGRGQGRKPIDQNEETITVSVRMTSSQREKLSNLGGAAWIRKQIDKS